MQEYLLFNGQQKLLKIAQEAQRSKTWAMDTRIEKYQHKKK